MEKTLQAPNLNELLEITQKLSEFQLVHNELRKDYLAVYEIATKNLNDEQTRNPLIRACVKELFALLEADIYLYNQFNPYKSYSDNHSFCDKFKKTFKHHAITFGKEDLQVNFNSKYFNTILSQKEVRDRTTHPKGQVSILVDDETLKEVNSLYTVYTKYISEMMTNVFVSTKIKFF